MTNEHRSSQIDGLRALAALGVVIFHYFSFPEHLGSFGVQLFFMISGYVITGSLSRSSDLRIFWTHRVLRLYPAYWLSVIVAAIALHVSGQTVTAQGVAVNLTMFQWYLGYPDLIDPYWTLAYELVFYILMSVVVLVGLIARLEYFAIGWAILMLIARLAEPLSSWLATDYRLDLLLMPSFGHLFLIGMMIWRSSNGGGRLAVAIAVALLGLSLFGRTDWEPIPGPMYAVSNCIFAGLLWLAARGSLSLAGVKPLALLGVASYSIYLFHVPILILAQTYLPGASVWGVAALGMPVTLGVSFAVWSAVERPAQQLAKWVSSRARTIATPAV